MNIFYTLTNAKQRLIVSSLIIIVFFLIANSASANKNGTKTGLTSNTSQGCGQGCHANSASSSVKVSITSDNGQFTTSTNSVLIFTLTIDCPGKVTAGCDIAVKTTTTGATNIGTLAQETGQGLQLKSGELTHTSPKTMTNGSVIFRFSWTAPATAGTYYLRAIGNATNGNNSEDSGDLWNWLSVTTLTVTSAGSIAVTSPKGGELWDQGSIHGISWTSSGVSTCKIELSSDGGSTYPTIIASTVNAALGLYNWTIPSGLVTGAQYKIKITDESNIATFATSAANFSITKPSSVFDQVISSENFRTFPNPATEAISFESLTGSNIYLKIMDIFGLTVTEIELKPGEKLEWNLCDLSGKSLPAGIYYAITYYDDKKSLQKITIVK
ncbi:MAG: hypothetical protein NT007_17040 [Candidatus Kapabacteria bacterium]|nr:hypothetical protein [Candidatus Kapabacteria bacterium]